MHVPTMYFHLQFSNSLRRIPVAVSKAKIGFMGSGKLPAPSKCSGLRSWFLSSLNLGVVTSRRDGKAGQ